MSPWPRHLVPTDRPHRACSGGADDGPGGPAISAPIAAPVAPAASAPPPEASTWSFFSLLMRFPLSIRRKAAVDQSGSAGAVGTWALSLATRQACSTAPRASTQARRDGALYASQPRSSCLPAPRSAGPGAHERVAPLLRHVIAHARPVENTRNPEDGLEGIQVEGWPRHRQRRRVAPARSRRAALRSATPDGCSLEILGNCRRARVRLMSLAHRSRDPGSV